MLLHCIDLSLIEYQQALQLQEELLMQRYRGECEDTLLLLEHPSVFTLGRGGNANNLLTPHDLPVHRVGRGGDVTYHGPGQLVGYPIVHLGAHGRDVHAYLRGLEAVLIQVLSQYDIVAHRAQGLTGVWVGNEKIASIGVGVRHWVTYHGFALNVEPELSYFSDIIPCGLVDVQMTSMASLLARPVAVDTVKPVIVEAFARYFGYKDIVWQNL
ncbi:MAG: lipoyl(octanoyl) transferase LipB [Deltaproteobacteria bacterium]|nr:lipoyl(octanoyl) transferase LipB [Deltaproteobacteria bacterium]